MAEVPFAIGWLFLGHCFPSAASFIEIHPAVLALHTDSRTSTMARNEHAWRTFADGVWQDEINVRDFIVSNVTPFSGSPDFLAAPSARTRAVWDALQPYFREEIQRGVLDVDASIPASLTAFGPGYIDRENEVIVGLQTDKPFKRAIMPTGGFRMVEAGLKAAGVAVDPTVRNVFTKYRKTHNDGIFDLYTPEILERSSNVGARASSPACRTPTAGGASSVTIVALPSTASTG
jgi:formate C-acetyltransferase